MARAMLAVLLAWIAAPTGRAQSPRYPTFPTAEAAVQALLGSVKAGNLDELLAIFGTDGKELVASSDPVTARKNREVFLVAAREHWELVDHGPNRKTLVVGNEQWPFPVPLMKDGAGWRFDTSAGKEEILTRRIGRNELAVIETCRSYVAAQHRYARQGHDGKRAGLYAMTFRSDPGKENGLYWPISKGQKPSPLGDLIAQAAAEGRPAGTGGEQPPPFQGYYYKTLTGQGPAAHGGSKDYIVNGEMSGGFGLVAWPAQYRRHRSDDLHRFSGQRRAREGSRSEHRRHRAKHDEVQPGRQLAPRAVTADDAWRRGTALHPLGVAAPLVFGVNPEPDHLTPVRGLPTISVRRPPSRHSRP